MKRPRWSRLAIFMAFHFLGSAPGAAQALPEVADSARAFWLRHDAPSLVGSGGRVVVQLPGRELTAPLGRRQAAALLTDYLSACEELEVIIRATRLVDEGAGYVELRRRYRLQGAQGERAEAVLLSYRQSGDGWELVEVRVAR